ncbi:MAG: DUF3710 domain-containing protein [Marmoricola sp.]
MRFGRRSRDDQPEEGQAPEPADDLPLEPPARGTGPFDAAEVEDLDDWEGIDLGSLLVLPAGPMEMRLQVDEDSGEVIAAVLVGEQGALELRAFAAARGGGSWDELRPRISAETARMGGTATEEEGTFGTELVCVVPMQGPDGQQAMQVSRISGHEGPNWLLRATLMGQPAAEPEQDGPWLDTIRSVVVRRGREAMAPGAPLRLTLPPDARQVE